MRIARQYIYRVLIYILGLLFMAFSVAVALNSELGISPVNSLPYAISLVSGIDLSLCVIGVFSLYVLIQILLLRRNFKWYNLFQFVFSTIFGYFTGFAKFALGDFCLPGYPGRLAMLLISIGLAATGISLYVNVKLIPMPAEGLTLVLSQKFKKPFNRIKVTQDCISVALAAVIMLVFLGGLNGVKEGTVISALLVGTIIKLIQKYIRPLVERICFH